MLAELIVLLPYSIVIPEGEVFPLVQYDLSEYKVCIYPPVKCHDNPFMDDPDTVSVDGVKAYLANGLRIRFLKEEFDRNEQLVMKDPSLEIIQDVISSFLKRVRFVIKTAKIKDVNIRETKWKLTYLNDDGTELEKEEGKIRSLGGGATTMSCRTINANIWQEVHLLPHEFVPPRWDVLLLDALEILPQQGPAIVLASAGLEVFIAHILTELQSRFPIPNRLWEWINNRSHFLQEPSVADEFDVLLEVLGGFSLKESQEHWGTFTKLKAVRNEFVHAGGVEFKGKPLSVDETRGLIAGAIAIIKYVRDKLPPDMQWREYDFKIQMQMEKKLQL